MKPDELTYRTAYGPKIKSTLICPPGLTKQAHAHESEINNIMAKYIRTGILEHANNHSLQYGFATSDDYHSSLNLLIEAQNMFNELPSQARTKFRNDPGEFLEFVQDPDNAPYMYDLGLSDTPYNPVALAAETVAEATPSTPESA